MDWTVIIIVAIAAIPPTVAGIAAYRQADKVEEAVREVHTALNSRLTALLEVTASSSRMEGAEQERREARFRDDAEAQREQHRAS